MMVVQGPPRSCNEGAVDGPTERSAEISCPHRADPAALARGATSNASSALLDARDYHASTVWPDHLVTDEEQVIASVPPLADAPQVG